MTEREIRIKCPKGCDQVTLEWKKFVFQPGAEFGITKDRFLVLPSIYCVKCYSRCDIEIIETTSEMVEQKETIFRLLT